MRGGNGLLYSVGLHVWVIGVCKGSVTPGQDRGLEGKLEASELTLCFVLLEVQTCLSV